MCLDHMRRAPERTCRWRRTLPYPEPSTPSAAFFPCRSSADCTIITSGCDLRYGQAGLSLAGCASTEGVRFQALAQQQALVRDGRAALVSKKQNSIVMITPAGRRMETGRRPVYVVGLFNSSSNPSDFRVADIRVTQSVGGRIVPLPVLPYEE